MSRSLTINGLPAALQNDGWWLSNTTHPDRPRIKARADRTLPRFAAPAGCALALVALADWLFWGHNLGVSVALFAMALSIAMLGLKPGGANTREWVGMLVLQTLCNLPVIELLQPLSVFFSLLGLSTLVGWLGYERIVTWRQGAAAMLRMSTLGALLLPRQIAEEARKADPRVQMAGLAQSLILPLSIGIVFVFLFSTANPVLEQAIDELIYFDYLHLSLLDRAIFWLIAAALLWPYLNLPGDWLGPLRETPAPGAPGQLRSYVITPASVRNSLLLFNLMFLLQTTMDISFLFGDMELPAGMSYASYARRGAYPLVVTALMVGLFAIATRDMIAQHPMLRRLMYLWLGQTLFLVFTAAYRLNLYVEVYQLTYLRLWAFIWMALVFAGLILIIAQILWGKSTAWLTRGLLWVVIPTLYACCFVNFAHVIAEYNLRDEQRHVALDSWYVCHLGRYAEPAIQRHEIETGQTVCGPRHMQPIGNDWREWGFRDWRVRDYAGA